MVISFYGENCFKIQSGETAILTDLFTNKSGLIPPRFKPDISIKTLTPFPLPEQPSSREATHSIYGPGEYNMKNIDIAGFGLIGESSEKFFKTAYLIKTENIKIGFFGHLSEAPKPEILERFEGSDLLFIPAGGLPFIEQKSAVKLIKQIEPKIVIPSFFKIPGLKRKADDIKKFIEEFNGQKAAPREKLAIKKKDLGEIKKTEIIALKP